MRTHDPIKAQQRKAQILTAAISCFIKSGFHNTGMKEICAAAGMSPGGLYRYFESKSAIIKAIVEREQQEFSDILEEVRNAEDFKTAIFSFLHDFTEQACFKPDNILGTEIFAESTRNPEIAEILKKSETTLLAELQSVLREAVQDRKIILKLSIVETARTMWSLAYGFSALVLLDEQTDEKTLAQLSTTVLENLIQ